MIVGLAFGVVFEFIARGARAEKLSLCVSADLRAGIERAFVEICANGGGVWFEDVTLFAEA